MFASTFCFVQGMGEIDEQLQKMTQSQEQQEISV